MGSAQLIEYLHMHRPKACYLGHVERRALADYLRLDCGLPVMCVTLPAFSDGRVMELMNIPVYPVALTNHIGFSFPPPYDDPYETHARLQAKAD